MLPAGYAAWARQSAPSYQNLERISRSRVGKEMGTNRAAARFGLER
jgi:hypothetical protein